MSAGTFHIGRSKSCHLRLGDESIPKLLAVIVADRKSARISSQCSSPLLLLNGEAIEDSPLSDGDQLEAGPYTLVFHRLPNGAVSISQDDDDAFDSSQADASELVGALEEELAVVEELAHTPLRGWQELAGRLSDTEAPDSVVESRDVIPIDDMHSLLCRLDQGQQRLRLQQDAILRELAELRQQQNVLVESLQPPAESVVPIRPTGPLSPRRASA